MKTKQEQRMMLAGMAMQGHCTNPAEEIRTASSSQIAEWSIEYADALLAELDRTATAGESSLVQPDAEDWIPHNPGGPMPCRKSMLVDIQFPNGEIHRRVDPLDYDWGSHPLEPEFNIVKWRPAQ